MRPTWARLPVLCLAGGASRSPEKGMSLEFAPFFRLRIVGVLVKGGITMNRVMRIRVGALLSVAVLGLIVLVAFSQQEKQAVVDPDAYTEFMSSEVADICDLQDYFLEQQSSFLPVLPPDPTFVLKQPGSPMVLPFDWANFPPEFNKNLTAEYENSVPVYPITILEDPATRETIFLNSKGEDLLALPPPKDYDPYAYLKAIFPSLYSGWHSSDLISYWQGFYDPSRIQIAAKLIPAEYVEPYLYVAARLADETALSPSGGEGGMLLRSEEAETEIVFESLKRTNAGNRIVIGYPDEFTNRLDVFTCNDLMPYIWTFAAKGLSTTGANEILWYDTNYWVFSGPFIRFYSAGNADLDTDGDGYSDASERLVYVTDPANPTSRPVFVSGTVSYSGIETGAIYVLPARSEESWSLAGSVARSGPGAWSNEVGINQSFCFRAFRDVNTNYLREIWEPWGCYSNTATTITGTTSGLNITLQDQPSVWGSLSYTGSVNGDIWVLAVTAPDSWDTAYSTVIPWSNEGITGEFTYVSFPVGYALTELPASNYWIRAFVDSNTNETMNLPELAGQYGATAIAVSNRRTEIDFSLHGPPSVSGTVSYATYSGGQTGLIYVLATATSNSCATNYSTVLSEPGSYQLTNLPVGIYWIWAWRNSDGNNTCGVYEARGYYTNQAILVTGQLINVNIAMTDPDTDVDGMGDWWEAMYFGNLNQTNSGDYDIDKLVNLYEYYAGTDPTAGFVDTDGDGMSHDWENYYGLDDDWNGDASLDSDYDGWTNLEEYDAGTDPSQAYYHPGNCLYVATNGVDAAGRGFYTNPLASISYAVNQAADSNRIIILPGIHAGASNRNISLPSMNLTFTGIMGAQYETIVDAERCGRFLSVAENVNVTIRYLTLRNGYADTELGETGGALWTDSAFFTIQCCIFSSNEAPYGGAVYLDGGAVMAESCLFMGNIASNQGGALLLASPAWLINCTFVNNAAGDGDAIYKYASVCSITNSIVWGDIVGTNWHASYSCVQGATAPTGPGNINSNPLFEADGWHLSRCSPCRNAGTNLEGMTWQTDLDGNAKVSEGIVDMGADEYAPTNLPTLMHMPSYDQSNTWGVTVAGYTTRVWFSVSGDICEQCPPACMLDFGDGQQSAYLVASNETMGRYMVTNHVFATAAVYNVTASLREGAGGVLLAQSFQIACRPTNDYDAHILHAIENGLIWLYTNAIPDPSGFLWHHGYPSYSSYVASANGMAISAFASFGHNALNTNDVYADTLEKGLEYILIECLRTGAISSAQCHYDPDYNTNGFGITIISDKELYEIGPVMSAIVKAGSQDRLAPSSAPAGIADRSYGAIIQDMADYCGWAQADTTNDYARGGWRYEPNVRADNSASLWPALGLYSAEKWGIIMTNDYTTNNLKKELAIWVARSQNSTGSFSYSNGWWIVEANVARTAYGCVQMAYLGYSIIDTQVFLARNYIGSHYGHTMTNLYEMHGLAQASVMFQDSIEMYGTQCWRYVCASNLVKRQSASGKWSGFYSTQQIGDGFGTAAAIAILAETAPWRIVVTRMYHSPQEVHTNNVAQVHASVLDRPGTTNLMLTVWYRTAQTNNFISLAMTNYLNTYTSTSSIPACPAGTTGEYFLIATYWREGVVLTNRYPSACTNDYVSYVVIP